MNRNFFETVVTLGKTQQEDALWNALKKLQGRTFFTVKGLPFTYEIKGKEMFINRKMKSVTWATIVMAFHTAMQLQGKVNGPKKLKVFGSSYLYPIFVQLGIIQQKKNGGIV